MSEANPGDSPHTRPEEQEQRQYELAPFAEDFIDYLQWQESDPLLSGGLSETERLANRPYHVLDFVRIAYEKMPWPYKLPEHEIMDGRGRLGELVLVSDIIHDIQQRYQTISEGGSRRGSVDTEARHVFLVTERNLGMRYYLKFPEILGADRLADQLQKKGKSDLAENVLLVQAAYGSAARRLAPHRLRIPAAYLNREDQ